jgi:hypothetical protein
MKEFDFVSAEIQLVLPGMDSEFFSFGKSDSPDEPFSLKFPIVHNDKHIGTLSLMKEANGNPMLCVSELTSTISDAVMDFIEKNRD